MFDFLLSLSVVTDVLDIIGEVGPGVIGIFADTITAAVDIFYTGTPTPALTIPGVLGVVGLGWAIARKMFGFLRSLFAMRG